MIEINLVKNVFKDVNEELECTLENCHLWKQVENRTYDGCDDYDASIESIRECHTSGYSFIPKKGGEWEDEPGDSKWIPNENEVPGDRHGTNPEHKTWGDLEKEYDFDSIPFEDGEPDFSEVSKGEVQIDDFTEDRSSNFDQADEKLAEQRGCTPEEVAKWRKENKYTWHECKDCETMQKVPTEVHGNIPHSGGISEQKTYNQTR